VPLGTLSSRLVKARRLLAKRLARSGLSLSGTALTVVLSEAAVSAAVPAPLVSETVRAAALVAAGQLAAVATPAALLTKGVLTAMLMTKLKFVLGMLLTVAVLGATGLAYRAGAQGPPTDTPRVEKPRSELEALRRENELLKLNLEVVLEKVRAQEAELRTLRSQGKPTRPPGAVKDPQLKFDEKKVQPETLDEIERFKKLKALERHKAETLKKMKLDRDKAAEWGRAEEAKKRAPDTDAVKQLEDALKALQAAPKFEEKQRAVEALEQALRKLKAQQQPSKR